MKSIEGKSDNYTVEYVALIIGALYSLAVFLGALDGEFIEHIKDGGIIIHNKATDPEGFWRAVKARVTMGLIVSGSALMLIYIQKSNNEKIPKP